MDTCKPSNVELVIVEDEHDACVLHFLATNGNLFPARLTVTLTVSANTAHTTSEHGQGGEEHTRIEQPHQESMLLLECIGCGLGESPSAAVGSAAGVGPVASPPPSGGGRCSGGETSHHSYYHREWRKGAPSEAQCDGPCHREDAPLHLLRASSTLPALPQGSVRTEGGVRTEDRSATTLHRVATVRRSCAGLRVDVEWLACRTSAHDASAIYHYPFSHTEEQGEAAGGGGGAPLYCCRGPNEGSHTGKYGHSIDFSCPEGTRVLCSRAGTVLGCKWDSCEGGPQRDMMGKANFVSVVHTDGSEAVYGHLAPGLCVEVGQSVCVGQLLGLSGNTGFSDIPHIHFMVLDFPEGDTTLHTGGTEWGTVPVDFAGPGGERERPRRGLYYPGGLSPGERTEAVLGSDALCSCESVG